MFKIGTKVELTDKEFPDSKINGFIDGIVLGDFIGFANMWYEFQRPMYRVTYQNTKLYVEIENDPIFILKVIEKRKN